ncbi:MAG: FkbM family methyltransferase [Patescibacteria group bacterium]|nr:FkbM family methyltransferase [Patescibacteria group bacterium]
MLHRTFEPLTTKVFEGVIKPGMTVVDLGANIGYFTLLAARLVGHEGKVFAFEPEPKNFSLLQKNISDNHYRNIVAVQSAVTDKIATVKLFLSRTNKGGHSLLPPQDSEGAVLVPSMSINSYFANSPSHIDLIKMDIEGAEPLALNGMEEVLKKNPNIILITEFNPTVIRKGGCRPELFLQMLQRHFPTIIEIDEENSQFHTIGDARTLQPIFNDANYYHNLICLRNTVDFGWLMASVSHART